MSWMKADVVLGCPEDCSRATSSEMHPSPFTECLGSWVRFSNHSVPLSGREEALQETADEDSPTPIILINSTTLPSRLWTLPSHWPSRTSSSASSRTACLFVALVLRGTNAFCIGSCEKAAQVSLVIILARRTLAHTEAVGLTISQDFSQLLFLPQLNALVSSILPHCYSH